MADPRRVRPDELEILVARELRKAGLELTRAKLVARRALTPSSDDASEYVAELEGTVIDGGKERPLVIECRNTASPVGADAVDAFAAACLAREAPNAVPDPLASPRSEPRRLQPPDGSPAPEPPVPIMFSMSSYDAAAVRAARSHGIALLTIADGPSAFVRSPWAVGGQPPAWVPEYMAELVDLDPAGMVRRQMLVAGRAKLILGR